MVPDPFPKEIPLNGQHIRFTVASITGPQGDRDPLAVDVVETSVVSRVWSEYLQRADCNLAGDLGYLSYFLQNPTDRKPGWVYVDNDGNDREVGAVEVVPWVRID